MPVTPHTTYKRNFLIGAHAIRQLRDRAQDKDVKCMTDVDLSNVLDLKLTEAFQSENYEEMIDAGEPIWTVKLWDNMEGLSAVLKNNKLHRSTGFAKAVVTVLTNAMVDQAKSGRNKKGIQWTWPNGMMPPVESSKEPTVAEVPKGPPAPPPVAPELSKQSDDLWLVGYVDPDTGQEWEKVAKKDIETFCSKLLSDGVKSSNITVYKPVKFSIRASIQFNE